MKLKNKIYFLEGKDIYLRPFDLKDINKKYLTWVNNPDINHGIEGRYPVNEVEAKKFFSERSNTKNSVLFAICLKKNNQHIGNCSVSNIDWINRRAHFNIMIGVPAYRGPHYIDTLRTVTAYAFNHLNLNKLTGASEIPDLELIHKKLGWKTEGIWKKHNYRNGKYVDIKLFAIFKDDFKKL